MGPPVRVTVEFEGGNTIVLEDCINAVMEENTEYLSHYAMSGEGRRETNRVATNQEFQLTVTAGRIEQSRSAILRDQESAQQAEIMAAVAARTRMSVSEVMSVFERLGQAGISGTEAGESLAEAFRQMSGEEEPPESLIRVIRFLKKDGKHGEDDG